MSRLSQIALELRDLVAAAKIAKTVRVSTATDYKQIFAEFSSLRTLPAVIVVVGPGAYDPDSDLFTLRPALVVVDEFRADAENKSIAVWDLVEMTAKLFAESARRKPCTLLDGQVTVSVDNVYPLNIVVDKSSYLIELSAVMPGL